VISDIEADQTLEKIFFFKIFVDMQMRTVKGTETLSDKNEPDRKKVSLFPKKGNFGC